MDMVDFNPIEESEEDHNLQDYFPEQVPYHLQHLIEYRVKLLLKNDALFIPGETQVVNTSCVLGGKIRRAMSMHLTPFENLPLSFESGGYISGKYSGRVVIRTWTPSQNTLILLNKNLKIYESFMDKRVNIGQKAYDFPMVSQAAFEN